MSGAPTAAPIALDHLVVACRTLARGRDWCAATFGVAPAPGGRHALMGTHNALLSIASARFPQAYLELIAIDPEAPPPGRRRWFDLDDAALQAALAEPRLVHWVARTDDIDAAVVALRRHGHEPGTIVDAERATPRGLLRWRIAVADDGRRGSGGAVPLLIEWRAGHPADALPGSGVALGSLAVGGVSAALAGLLGVDALPMGSADALVGDLQSPRGPVRLAGPRGSTR